MNKNTLKIFCFLNLILILNCSTNNKFNLNIENLDELVICTLEINRKIISLNDEVLISFLIKNNSEEIIYINNSPTGYYINGQQIEGFNIEIKDKTGNELKPEKDYITINSFRSGITAVKPNQTLRIEIRNLNKYGISNTEGEYVIEIERSMNIYMNPKKRIKYPFTLNDFKKYINVTCSAKTQLNVVLDND